MIEKIRVSIWKITLTLLIPSYFVFRLPAAGRYLVSQETFFPNSFGNFTTYAITNPGIVAITTQTKNPG